MSAPQTDEDRKDAAIERVARARSKVRFLDALAEYAAVVREEERREATHAALAAVRAWIDERSDWADHASLDCGPEFASGMRSVLAILADLDKETP